jgi:hypothetical protein
MSTTTIHWKEVSETRSHIWYGKASLRAAHATTYQIPSQAAVQHFDLVQGQPHALRVTAARLQRSSQHHLHFADVLIQLLVIGRIGFRCVQEGPSEEILYVLTLYFTHGRVSKPFPQVSFRVRNVDVAAPEQRSAILRGESRWVSGWSLKVQMERNVNYEEESGLDSKPYLEYAGDEAWQMKQG